MKYGRLEEMLSQDELKELLHYEPETGVFTWKERKLSSFKNTRCGATWNTRFAGKVAGWYDNLGYIYIRVNKVLYPAHRLAILYTTGEFPNDVIDHINRDTSDNRLLNIRCCSHADNMQNKVNNSKVIGTCFNKSRNKWNAYTKQTSSEKQSLIGYFVEYWDAICARKSWEVYNA